MKKIVMFSLFLSMIILGSCTKNSTGDLRVVVKNLAGDVMVSKQVFIYATQSDFNTGTYLKDGLTDATGVVNFTLLPPQTYWIDCDFTILGIPTTATGTATVEKKQITTVLITP
jgi:hypothetical protein